MLPIFLACLLFLGVATIWATWRVGSDRALPASSVPRGAFRFSRNLALLQPGAITIDALIAANLILSVRIRLEEQDLRSTHSSAYDAYAASVRRWI